MTAIEKAKAGYWLFREAIRDLIAERGPLNPSDIEHILEDALKMNMRGVTFETMKRMTEMGELHKGDGLKPPYSLPARSTHQ